LPVYDDEEYNRGTQTIHCIFCQRPFLVPIAFYERMQGKYHCDQCIEVAWVLRQPHVLYVRMPSRDELTGIATRLLTVSKPCAGTFHQASSGSWSLTFWYDEIGYELLILLSSLQVRYSLDNLHRDEDTLTFWPGDATPGGTLGSLIKEILTYGND
jgi:hypothetical protein